MSADIALLSRFEPVCHLTQEHQVEIAAMSRVEQVLKGRDIRHFAESSHRSYYLVAGEVRLAYADGTDAVIRPDDDAARYPIGSGEKQVSSATVTSDADILVVDSDQADILMTWEQMPIGPAEMEFVHVAESSVEVTKLFGANRLRGGAFSSLPSANIDELFRRMVSVPVKAGQVIIKQGEEGDNYYLIESGRARVTRLSGPGAEPVVIARLEDGDGFGEEAPASDNRRNATVTMETDGVLLQLSKQDFVELLKAPLLNRISRQAAEHKIVAGARWIDVRLPSEFAHAHFPGAINLPLHEIRDALSTLNPHQTYITYCKTGRRSSAAAFIMSQLGFDVYTLEGDASDGGDQ